MTSTNRLGAFSEYKFASTIITPTTAPCETAYGGRDTARSQAARAVRGSEAERGEGGHEGDAEETHDDDQGLVGGCQPGLAKENGGKD